MKTIKRYYSAKTAAYPASTQSNNNSPKGSINNPYTQEEFESFEDGTWPGGWVEGMGYVIPQVNINGSRSSSSDPYSSGSDPSDPWGSLSSNPWASDGSNPNGNNPGGGGGGNAGGTGRPGTSGGTGNSNNSSNIKLAGKYTKISQYSRNILLNLKGYKGTIYITSIARTPEEQARAMLNNIKKNGVQSQLNLYREPGQSVVRVYNSNLTDAQNIAAMTAKIIEVGPSNVSHHCADTSVLNVIDVSRSNLANADAFLNALEIEKQKGVISKYIDEKNNNCVHIEIPQP